MLEEGWSRLGDSDMVALGPLTRNPRDGGNLTLWTHPLWLLAAAFVAFAPACAVQRGR